MNGNMSKILQIKVDFKFMYSTSEAWIVCDLSGYLFWFRIIPPALCDLMQFQIACNSKLSFLAAADDGGDVKLKVLKLVGCVNNSFKLGSLLIDFLAVESEWADAVHAQPNSDPIELVTWQLQSRQEEYGYTQIGVAILVPVSSDLAVLESKSYPCIQGDNDVKESTNTVQQGGKTDFDFLVFQAVCLEQVLQVHTRGAWQGCRKLVGRFSSYTLTPGRSIDSIPLFLIT
ncbi:hypothetical protein CFP56_017564 [Quercus suber]|uniref:Uncharacterized protein n=1 Tax=Quercus suber TaxID=58331 RepID=A0AAW0KMQ1_QUESU